MVNRSRIFDVVLYGATGFTGRLAAHYLAQKGETTRWAIAGRNRQKLEKLAAELEQLDARWAGLPILEADASDPESLHRMASQTRVVASTVGPFHRYGMPLVHACVEEGTHYCDITGEPQFVDETLKLRKEAAEKKLRLISCCGFDSVPHDLGAWLCARELPNDEKKTVRGYVKTRGSVSGGTWQTLVSSLANFREIQKKRKGRARIKATNGRKVKKLDKGVHRIEALGGWAMPLPTIDPEIVGRSAKFMDEFGPEFRYGHFLRLKSLPQVAAVGAGGIGTFALAQLGPTRKLLEDYRKSGDGPDKEARDKSFFEVTFFGESASGKSRAVVSGGDPGYDETAKMLAESALSLALDENLPERFGVLTPASGIGQALIDRLNAAGMRLESKRL